MKLLNSLLFVVLMTGCTLFNKPKYKAGDCFNVSPFLIIEVVEVKKESYLINVHQIISYQKEISIEEFEKTAKESGDVPVSCNELFKEQE